MKAVLSKAPGGPETLVVEEVAAPRPGKGEVLIAVAACGVNYPDSLIIEDKYQVKPQRPFAPGGEFAGNNRSPSAKASHICASASACSASRLGRHGRESRGQRQDTACRSPIPCRLTKPPRC